MKQFAAHAVGADTGSEYLIHGIKNSKVKIKKLRNYFEYSPFDF